MRSGSRARWGCTTGIPLRARRLARLYRPFLPPGALGFDIGAHVGNRVRCWRTLGARVVAVEPQPDLRRILERLYGRDERVGGKVVALSQYRRSLAPWS